MPDRSVIATKLAALVEKNARLKDGKRLISHDLPPLAAILREIDDTVLERTLIFGIGQTNVHAVVAGRRLKGIVEISGDVTAQDDIVGQIFSRDDPAPLAAIGTLLKKLCDATPQVTVISTAPRPLGSSAEAGVATAALASAWAVDTVRQPATALQQFVAANVALITASYHVADGQPPQTTGDTARLQDIWKTQITLFRKRHKSVVGKPATPMLIGIQTKQPNQMLCLAVVDGEQCLISGPADGLPALLASWTQIFGD
ncbi:hypothetical protein [Yoonia sp.]|uniref:hypothetical protein n=1 Tax=Yoonia sp. TaxID=2212373 RepID=UPI0019E801A7|nr:hypothetical protein [Yoonia sp.]MBE0412308.1 hypothetical protein [Yoonia sp.]